MTLKSCRIVLQQGTTVAKILIWLGSDLLICLLWICKPCLQSAKSLETFIAHQSLICMWHDMVARGGSYTCLWFYTYIDVLVSCTYVYVFLYVDVYIYICMMYVCVFLFKAGQGSGREGQHDRTGWRGCSNELWMVQEIRLNTRPMLVYTCYKCNLEGHYNGFGMICSSFSSSQIDMNSHLYHGEWV